jgi:hypothetical protein
MPCPRGENSEPTCPKISEHQAGHGRLRWWWGLIPVAGLLSLVWFLVRVGPKPSRAAYPCQRVAAPLAGGFLLWIAGLAGSAFAFRGARDFLKRSKLALALACLSVAAVMAVVAVYNMPERQLVAANPEPNAPIGDAKGIHPGRVVWIHDPSATDWQGPGYGHWWESSHTNQTVVDGMLSRAIRSLSGETSDASAWNAIIRHYNQTHGRGNVGYTAGEKICIKINLVGCIYNSWGGVDASSYDLVSKIDYMNTSPQMMVALLRQLVNVVGVNQADISIGDPLGRFPNQYYNLCHAEFPDVHYLDHDGGNTGHPRTKVVPSTVRFYFSTRPTGKTADYIPLPYAEATYFIDLANFKSHSSAAVTLCGKNHYGSLNRTPVEGGYYSLHDSLPEFTPGMGHYRALVDLLGYAHTGGKAVLYLIDGLYAGVHPTEESPRKLNMAPFNGDWTSSVFASQDPMAIDSVAFDFLWNEWSGYPHMSGGDDYLHEGALANNPPSGTFYDSDHATATVRMGSLGTHEHWNNAQDRQYSRNLGTGNGIELIKGGWPVAIIDATPVSGRAPLTVSFDASRSFDSDGTIAAYQWDFDSNGTIDATGQSVSHTYSQVRDYTASLTVVDNDAFSESATVRITIDRQPGDFDGDYDVDQIDFGAFQLCLSGTGIAIPSGCEDADLDHDHDVDILDAYVFQGCLSGADVPASPACAD